MKLCGVDICIVFLDSNNNYHYILLHNGMAHIKLIVVKVIPSINIRTLELRS